MSAVSHFVYTDRLADGQERLMLAALRYGPGRRNMRWAKVLGELHRVNGDGSYGSQDYAQETYRQIVVSPSNEYAAVYSAENAIDFEDRNVSVFDMDTGAQVHFFNEHTFSNTNRFNCYSHVFANYLAQEAAFGVPADVLDTHDYHLEVEHGYIGTPLLSWTQDETIACRIALEVWIEGGYVDSETFTFEIDPKPGPGRGIVSCNNLQSPIAAVPPPLLRIGGHDFPPKLFNVLHCARKERAPWERSARGFPGRFPATWMPLPFEPVLDLGIKPPLRPNDSLTSWARQIKTLRRIYPSIQMAGGWPH